MKRLQWKKASEQCSHTVQALQGKQVAVWLNVHIIYGNILFGLAEGWLGCSYMVILHRTVLQQSDWSHSIHTHTGTRAHTRAHTRTHTHTHINECEIEPVARWGPRQRWDISLSSPLSPPHPHLWCHWWIYISAPWERGRETCSSQL